MAIAMRLYHAYIQIIETTNQRTNTMTAQTKTTRKNVAAANKTIKATAKTKAKPTTPTTFTTVELATAHDMQAKTLRARIRRNAGAFAQYLADADTPHVFAAKHRKAVDALLNQ